MGSGWVSCDAWDSAQPMTPISIVTAVIATRIRAIRHRSGRAREQFLQIPFPNYCNGVRPVPSSLRTRGQYHRTTPRHTFDLALEDTKLRRIDEIVGGIHRKQRR